MILETLKHATLFLSPMSLLSAPYQQIVTKISDKKRESHFAREVGLPKTYSYITSPCKNFFGDVGRMPVKCGQISPSKGWVSIDRSIKAALLGTTPRPKAKSSTNDFVFPRSKYGYQKTGQTWITICLSLLVWRNHLSRNWVYCCLATREHRRYRCKSGRDSDLEAFSLYPSDGSLAPLAFRPST